MRWDCVCSELCTHRRQRRNVTYVTFLLWGRVALTEIVRFELRVEVVRNLVKIRTKISAKSEFDVALVPASYEVALAA